MASMSGIEIKNLKEFIGREGPTLQGDIYLNDEKLGFWSQDGNGGEDFFIFDDKNISEKKLDDFVRGNYPKIKFAGTEFPCTVSIFMENLANFMVLEENFDNMNKDGQSALLLEDDETNGTYRIIGYPPTYSNEQIMEDTKTFTDKICDEPRYIIFRSKDDFNVGKPLTKEMIIEGEIEYDR